MSNHDLSVIPECYVDTNLIETLVPPSSHYNHQKGCGSVTSVMQQKFADGFALGIIDKDKREVDYLNQFSQVTAKGSLVLHKHQSRHHYIIQIGPAIESFILTNAKIASIDLTHYELPTELRHLMKQAKTVQSKNDPRFKRLFRAIYSSRTPDFVTLTAWIQYLIDNTYKSSPSELTPTYIEYTMIVNQRLLL